MHVNQDLHADVAPSARFGLNATPHCLNACVSAFRRPYILTRASVQLCKGMYGMQAIAGIQTGRFLALCELMEPGSTSHLYHLEHRPVVAAQFQKL